MKQYAVIGLGDFGMSLARHLSEHGSQVIAIDSNEDKVNEIADCATMAVCSDVNDIDELKSFDLGKLDGVIVSCGRDISPNIMAIVAARECGVPFILVKANDERIANLYRTVGATEVVFPEKEMGIRIARAILNDRFDDLIELEGNASLGEMIVPDRWVGKSIIDLNIRNRYNISVIAFKVGDKLVFNFDVQKKFEKGDIIMVVGNDSDLEKIK